MASALARFLAGDNPRLKNYFLGESNPLPTDEGYTAESETPQEAAARLENAKAIIPSAMASAADPFGIPSAVAGAISPTVRDKWREIENSSPAGIVGSLVGGTGAMKAAANAPGTLSKLAAYIGLGSGSDVIDASAGKEGAIGPATAGKALLAASGAAPSRLSALLAGAAGGGLIASGSQENANAAGATEEDPAGSVHTPYDQKMLALSKERESLSGQLQALEAARSKLANDMATEAQTGKGKLYQKKKEALDSWDSSNSNSVSDLRARLGALTDQMNRVSSEEGPQATEASEKRSQQSQAAEDARQQALKDTPAGDKPLRETLFGRIVGNPTAQSMVLGGLTGAILGGKSAVRNSRMNSQASRLGEILQSSKDPVDLARASGQLASLGKQASASPPKDWLYLAGASAAEGAGGAVLENQWNRHMAPGNYEREAILKAMEQLPADHPDRGRYQAMLDSGRYPEEHKARKLAYDASAKELGEDALMRTALGFGSGSVAKLLASAMGPNVQKIQDSIAQAKSSTVNPSAVEKQAHQLLAVQRAKDEFAADSQTLDKARQLRSAASGHDSKDLATVAAGPGDPRGLPAIAQQVAEMRGLPAVQHGSTSSSLVQKLAASQQPANGSVRNLPLVISSADDSLSSARSSQGFTLTPPPGQGPPVRAAAPEVPAADPVSPDQMVLNLPIWPHKASVPKSTAKAKGPSKIAEALSGVKPPTSGFDQESATKDIAAYLNSFKGKYRDQVAAELKSGDFTSLKYLVEKMQSRYGASPEATQVIIKQLSKLLN